MCTSLANAFSVAFSFWLRVPRVEATLGLELVNAFGVQSTAPKLAIVTKPATLTNGQCLPESGKAFQKLTLTITIAPQIQACRVNF
jgi:hypothetical protein